MFDPFAIKKLVSNSNSDTSNEIGFRESSTSVASSEAINKGSILPDINIYDNKFSKKESCTTNPKSCTEGCTIKFPIVNVKSHNSARIEDAENCHGMLFNKMDGRTTSQKSSLEESLKKSLENYCHPKFYLEGETKSTHHLMLEMNEFYLEMAEQLRYLKSGFLQKTEENAEVAESLNVPSSNYDMELNKLISSIEEDDQKVAENIKTLKEVKEERNIIQQEIQSLSGESDKTKETAQEKGDNNLVTYLLGPNIVPDVDNVEQNDKEPIKDNNKKKNVQLEGKNFIAKNKELAKEYNMTRFCLTDEEKRKLQLLLSDIDVCEERCEEIEKCIDEAKLQLDEVSEVKQFKETQNVGEQDCQNGKDDQTYNIDMCINGFKLDANDTEILNDLDLKISFLRTDDAKNETLQQTPETDDYKKLEAAEMKGKRWKFQLLQKRLKNIDRDLAAICLAKEKEKEDDRIDESENEILDDVARIKEEYNKSVYDISVDIGELEFQEAKELEELNNQVENT